MNAAGKELADLISELPEEQRREVLDFARFLKQKADDAEWERIISDKRPRPKLDAFVADALREGPVEPLNSGTL